jgi:xanthine dehydrogenase accessory factor
MKGIYKKINQSIINRDSFSLCTLISAIGSSPLKTGAKMLVYEKGDIYGTIGGGQLEKRVMEQAGKVIATGQPVILEYNLVKDLGMCCGGSVKVFIEMILPPPQLFIFGAGHVGKALATIAQNIDFEVSLIDDRLEIMNHIRDINARKVSTHPVTAAQKLKWDAQTYALIMTYDHQLDRDILINCIRKPFAYLGVIGSKRKTVITQKMLKESGIEKRLIDRVEMPVGIEIHAHTAEEIAISILGRLIQVKNTSADIKQKITDELIESSDCDQMVKSFKEKYLT